MKKKIYTHFIQLSAALACAAVLAGNLSIINPEGPDNGNPPIVTGQGEICDDGEDVPENQSEPTPENPRIAPHGDWDPDIFKK